MGATAIEKETEPTTTPENAYRAAVVATGKRERHEELPADNVLYGAGRMADQFWTDVKAYRLRRRWAADLAEADKAEAKLPAQPPAEPNQVGIINLPRAIDIRENQTRMEITTLRSFAKRSLRKTTSRSLHAQEAELSQQQSRLRANMLVEDDAAELKQIERDLDAAIEQGRRSAAVEARERLVFLRSSDRAAELLRNAAANRKAEKELAKLQEQVVAVGREMLLPENMELSA